MLIGSPVKRPVSMDNNPRFFDIEKMLFCTGFCFISAAKFGFMGNIV